MKVSSLSKNCFIVYHDISVSFCFIKFFFIQLDIPGSPYHPRVINTHKMRVIGGLENLVDEQNHIPLIVGEEKRIPFDVSDAGPGKN